MGTIADERAVSEWIDLRTYDDMGWSLDGRRLCCAGKMGGRIGPVPGIWFSLVNAVI
jgi:hypothetical protein